MVFYSNACGAVAVVQMHTKTKNLLPMEQTGIHVGSSSPVAGSRIDTVSIMPLSS